MIRFDRNGNGAVAPSKLVGQKKPENDGKLRDEYDAANAENRSMKFDSNIYGCKPVKNQLKKISYGKCCYCDCFIIDTQHCDVEHFRPKSKYWWLAYTWENLLLSCEICNQSFKSNEFPIAGIEATDPTSDLNLEEHLLINPIDEDPELILSYDDEGDGVSIIAKNANGQNRVDACIDCYGINRPDLLDSRRFKLRLLTVLKTVYEDPATSPHGKEILLQEMRNMADNNAELAGLVRHYLSYWGIPLQD